MPRSLLRGSLLVVVPLRWYENSGWRGFNPEIDLHGRWEYSIKYYEPDFSPLKKAASDNLKKMLEHLDENHGIVYMKQTLFHLAIQEGIGKLGADNAPVSTWKAHSVKVQRNGRVIINFESNLGGFLFAGIDDVTVESRENDDVGKPLLMQGHFKLIPESTDFVLRGEITYRRQNSMKDA